MRNSEWQYSESGDCVRAPYTHPIAFGRRLQSEYGDWEYGWVV